MEFPALIKSNWTSLLIEKPAAGIPYVTILSVASAVGTIGNALVVATMIRFLRSGSSKFKGDIFILKLACSDIIVTTIINPFAIVAQVMATFGVIEDILTMYSGPTFDGTAFSINSSSDDLGEYDDWARSMQVTGPASWYIFIDTFFSGRKMLLNEGYYNETMLADMQPADDFNLSTSSVKLENLQPTNRAIGVTNKYIIADSQMTAYQSNPSRNPHRARLWVQNNICPSGWTINPNSGHQGIQIDLGKLYRVFAIGTRGATYCNADKTSIIDKYYTTAYRIIYSSDAITWTTIKQNGVAKSFYGNNGATWNIENRNTFPSPIAASFVRVLTTAGSYRGLSVDFYGYEIPSALSIPRSTSSLFADLSLLVDNDLDTCVSTPSWRQTADYQVKVGQLNSDTVSINITTQADTCMDVMDLRIQAMVTATPNYNTPAPEKRQYNACIVQSDSSEGVKRTSVLECYYDYGNVEDVEIRIFNIGGTCVKVCEFQF